MVWLIIVIYVNVRFVFYVIVNFIVVLAYINLFMVYSYGYGVTIFYFIYI